MIKKRLSILFSFMLLFSSVYALEVQPLFIRPGKTESIIFQSFTEDPTEIALVSSSGIEMILFTGIPTIVGTNTFYWNGMDNNNRYMSPGDYVLYFRQSSAEQSVPITIGKEAPIIQSMIISSAEIIQGEEWSVTAHVNMPGTLMFRANINGMIETVASKQAVQGENTLSWNGLYHNMQVAPGSHMISVQLSDETGFFSQPHHIVLTMRDANGLLQESVSEPMQEQVESTEESWSTVDTGFDASHVIDTPATQQTISYKPPTAEHVPQEQLGSNYWTLPVGKMDEEAIWNVMIQPITIVKAATRKGDQKEMYRLRATPDTSMKNDNVLGEITCESQGVNILETLDNGWSYVEVFNSSYGPNCKSRPGWGNSDELIRGYVETNRLDTIVPRADFGMLIDKLTQEMLIFKEGKLFTTLLISTGLPTKQQPWNETPSGEFLLISRTGGFWAGNLYCDMAMRINGGCLIHEVPYILNEATNYKDYSSQEGLLGSKASHGCVRVQRKTNDDGFNMAWVWNNIKVNTKVLVWDDNPGRFHAYPSDDLKLYYNPTGGKNYHADARCRGVKSRWLPLKGEFTYGQLDDANYSQFTPCKSCNPPLRKHEIDALNKENGF
jgi:hypothetical protein